MEILREMLESFILFNLIEGVIIFLFFDCFSSFKRLNCKNIVFISLVNCVISYIAPPLLYQTLSLIIMMFIVSKNYNKRYKESLFISFLSIVFLLVVDMPFIMILDLFNIDFYSFTVLNKFLYLLIPKSIEIIILIKRRKYNEKRYVDRER